MSLGVRRERSHGYRHLGLGQRAQEGIFARRRVTAVNSSLIGGLIWNANSGVPDCQVVTDLTLPIDTDPGVAMKIGYEAAYSSPFLLRTKPVVVLISDQFDKMPYCRLRVKAYVFDHRFEPRLMSDITVRAKQEFLARGMLRAWSPAGQHKPRQEPLPSNQAGGELDES